MNFGRIDFVSEELRRQDKRDKADRNNALTLDKLKLVASGVRGFLEDNSIDSYERLNEGLKGVIGGGLVDGYVVVRKLDSGLFSFMYMIRATSCMALHFYPEDLKTPNLYFRTRQSLNSLGYIELDKLDFVYSKTLSREFSCFTDELRAVELI